MLYPVKNSRPNIANSVRELSKSMDGPTLAGMKELKRVMTYVIDTEEYGLKLYQDKMEQVGVLWCILIVLGKMIKNQELVSQDISYIFWSTDCMEKQILEERDLEFFQNRVCFPIRLCKGC